MLEDRYIGLLLAISSTIAIGASYVITKKGLQDASERHGFEGDGFQYLKNPIWWAGTTTLVLGEIANFAAYAYAPAILVTPLGALSVLTGAIFGAYFLKEKLGTLGKLGCGICLIGSVVIASHAPPDPEITTIDEILDLAIKPGFLVYCLLAAIGSIVMIYKIAPKYGKQSPLYYLSICAATGSVSVMSVKAFGIALKLTFDGKNQFTSPSTYVFIIVSVICILCQMNYLNKALSEFSQSIVNPVYYVFFTTAVLAASFVLFQGFNTTNAVNTISLLCGFLTIFAGVYLLNLSRRSPYAQQALEDDDDEDGIPTDGISGITTRYSMQSRRSMDQRRSFSNTSITLSPHTPRGDREHLIRAYDLENGNAFGLSDLTEDSEGEMGDSMYGNGHAMMNGKHLPSLRTP